MEIYRKMLENVSCALKIGLNRDICFKGKTFVIVGMRNEIIDDMEN